MLTNPKNKQIFLAVVATKKVQNRYCAKYTIVGDND